MIHRRRHPSKHARRLVLETATIDLTWHRYCLETHRIASGQKPAELQRTMREICAGPSDQLDHRLGINVAQALGPEACVRPGESTVAVSRLSPQEDTLRPAAGPLPEGLPDGLASCAQGLGVKPPVGGRIPRSVRHRVRQEECGQAGLSECRLSDLSTLARSFQDSQVLRVGRP